MASKDNLAEAARTGTVVVNIPPKPKFELLLGFVILTASLLLVISEFGKYRNTGKSYEK